MRILKKLDKDLFLVGQPNEQVKIGDSINSGGIVSQVIDLQFADLPGIMEHILRQSMITQEEITREILPDVKRMLETLTDLKLIRTKIRGHRREDGSFERGIGYFNISREKTSSEILQHSRLFGLLGINTNANFVLANTISDTSNESQDFSFDPNSLGITLITGQKKFGKSYFTKKFLLRLIDSGIGSVVFDPNNEYTGLGFYPADHPEHPAENGQAQPNDYFPRITTLDPSIEEDDTDNRIFRFRINLSDLNADDFNALYQMTENTAGEAHRFWNEQHRDGIHVFQIEDFEEWIRHQETAHNNNAQQGFGGFVSGALLARCRQARSSGLFGPTNIRGLLERLSNDGGALILRLKTVAPNMKPHVVKIVLSNMSTTAQNNNPLAVFLEEAQLYVEKNSMIYQDLLTRMRHVGIKPFFISNDPQTLPDQVLNLADNIFAFGFSSELIIKYLARSGKTDPDTFKTIENLERFQCMAIGDLTSNYPLYLHVPLEPNVQMGGETIEFNVNPGLGTGDPAIQPP